MSEEPESEKDARIRILQFQAEFLRRETEFVTKRYQDIVHSAAWTIAKPIKTFEDFLHRLFARGSARAAVAEDGQADGGLPEIPVGASDDEMAKVIAARIAARMTRPQERSPAAR